MTAGKFKEGSELLAMISLEVHASPFFSFSGKNV
jgi:hypothetical protein